MPGKGRGLALLTRLVDAFERRARRRRGEIYNLQRRTGTNRGRVVRILVSTRKPEGVEDWDDDAFFDFVRRHSALSRIYRVKDGVLDRLSPPQPVDVTVATTAPTVLFLRRGTDLDGRPYTPLAAYGYGHLRYELADEWDDFEATLDLVEQIFTQFSNDFRSLTPDAE